MITGDSAQRPSRGNERYLEAAVPLIAFGITIAGILLWKAGFAIDFQYVSIGCLVSSFILAYLAWTRPRKDIVALSTPIYGIVFLSAPIEAEAGAILQLFYAAGLTILLIRLKRRFSGDTSRIGALSSDEPLGRYRDRLVAGIHPVTPEIALAAARVFIDFAGGNYEQARDRATSAAELPDGADHELLMHAFAIVADRAGRMTDNSPPPAHFPAFSVSEAPLLFHQINDGLDRDHEYSLGLDNALIMLYIVSLGSQDKENLVMLDQLRPFVRKLCD